MGAKEIAIVHTIFNLSTSIVLLPFIKVLEKLAYLTVKDKEGEGNKDNIEEQFKLLDERFLQSPSFAVEKRAYKPHGRDSKRKHRHGNEHLRR